MEELNFPRGAVVRRKRHERRSKQQQEEERQRSCHRRDFRDDDKKKKKKRKSFDGEEEEEQQHDDKEDAVVVSRNRHKKHRKDATSSSSDRNNNSSSCDFLFGRRDDDDNDDNDDDDDNNSRRRSLKRRKGSRDSGAVTGGSDSYSAYHHKSMLPLGGGGVVWRDGRKTRNQRQRQHESDDGSYVEGITFSRLTPGAKMLGTVRQILAEKGVAVLGLPGKWTAFCVLSSVGGNDNGGGNAASVGRQLSLGQMLAVSVVRATDSSSSSYSGGVGGDPSLLSSSSSSSAGRRVQVTCQPAALNPSDDDDDDDDNNTTRTGDGPFDREGRVLRGQVLSVEDHGLLVDLGWDRRGFLPFSEIDRPSDTYYCFDDDDDDADGDGDGNDKEKKKRSEEREWLGPGRLLDVVVSSSSSSAIDDAKDGKKEEEKKKKLSAAEDRNRRHHRRRRIVPLCLPSAREMVYKYTKLSSSASAAVPPLHRLQPGTLVDCRTERVLSNGVCVTFGGRDGIFRGAIHVDHLGGYWTDPAEWKALFAGHSSPSSSSSSFFRARIVAVDAGHSKLVRLSLLPSVMALQTTAVGPADRRRCPPPPVGAVFRGATVLRLDPGVGVLLALPKKHSRDDNDDDNNDDNGNNDNNDNNNNDNGNNTKDEADEDDNKADEKNDNDDDDKTNAEEDEPAFALNESLWRARSYRDATTVRTAYVHISKATDHSNSSNSSEHNKLSASKFARLFPLNSQHVVRILHSHWYRTDGRVSSGATAPAIVAAHVLHHDDLKPGQVYRNVPVLTCLNGGSVLVDLGCGIGGGTGGGSGGGIRGLIPKLHLFDTATTGDGEYRRNVAKIKYSRPGARVAAVRVISVDAAARRCLLTAKKSLVKSKYDVPADWSSCRVGDCYTGFVSSVVDDDDRGRNGSNSSKSGVTVTFFNNVYGRVTCPSLRREMGVDVVSENYRAGDVVSCRVVHVKEKRRRDQRDSSRNRSRQRRDDNDEMMLADDDNDDIDDDDDDDDDRSSTTFRELTLSLKTAGAVSTSSSSSATATRRIKLSPGTVLPSRSMRVIRLVPGRCKNDDGTSYIPGYAICSIKQKYLLPDDDGDSNKNKEGNKTADDDKENQNNDGNDSDNDNDDDDNDDDDDVPYVDCKLPYDQLLDSYSAQDVATCRALDAVGHRLLSVDKKVNRLAMVLHDPVKTAAEYSAGTGAMVSVTIRPAWVRTALQWRDREEDEEEEEQKKKKQKKQKQEVQNDQEEGGDVNDDNNNNNNDVDDDDVMEDDNDDDDRLPVIPGRYREPVLHVGRAVQGYVTQVHSRHGAFVRFLNGRTGLVPVVRGGLLLPRYRTVRCTVVALDDHHNNHQAIRGGGGSSKPMKVLLSPVMNESNEDDDIKKKQKKEKKQKLGSITTKKKREKEEEEVQQHVSINVGDVIPKAAITKLDFFSARLHVVRSQLDNNDKDKDNNNNNNEEEQEQEGVCDDDEQIKKKKKMEKKEKKKKKKEKRVLRDYNDRVRVRLHFTMAECECDDGDDGDAMAVSSRREHPTTQKRQGIHGTKDEKHRRRDDGGDDDDEDEQQHPEITTVHPFYNWRVGRKLSDLTVLAVLVRRGITYVEVTNRKDKNGPNAVGGGGGDGAAAAALVTRDDRPTPAPLFLKSAGQLAPGQKVSGSVVSSNHIGVWLQLSPGVLGFIPAWEVSTTDCDLLNHLSDRFPAGSRLTCWVLKNEDGEQGRQEQQQEGENGKGDGDDGGGDGDDDGGRQQQPKGRRHRHRGTVILSLVNDGDNEAAAAAAASRKTASVPAAPKAGDLVVARIDRKLRGNQYRPPALRLKLPGGAVARCCITELQDPDEWRNLPLKRRKMQKQQQQQQTLDDDHFYRNRSADEYPHGKYVTCRVLSSPPEATGAVPPTPKSRSIVEVSLRKSRIRNSNSNDRTAQDDPPPAVGDVVQAYVVKTNRMGCFVRLSRLYEGRVLIKDLSDGFIQKPEKSFSPGRLVLGKVKAVHRDDDDDDDDDDVEAAAAAAKKKKKTHSAAAAAMAVDLDLRESAVRPDHQHNDAPVLEFDGIELNSKHKAVVTHVADYGVFVRLHNSRCTGLVHKSECSDGYIGGDLRDMYRVGDLVKVLVLKKDQDAGVTKQRLGLSMKASHFENDEDSSSSSSDEDDDDSSSVDSEDEDDDDDDSSSEDGKNKENPPSPTTTATLDFENVKVKGRYRAEVTRVMKFGLFVRLQDNRQLSGLVHKSQLVEEDDDDDNDSWFRVGRYRVGDVVRVRVLRKNPEKKQLTLGITSGQGGGRRKEQSADDNENDNDSGKKKKKVLRDAQGDEDLDSDDENFASKLAAKMSQGKGSLAQYGEEDTDGEQDDDDDDDDDDDMSERTDSGDSESETEEESESSSEEGDDDVDVDVEEEEQSTVLDTDVGFEWGGARCTQHKLTADNDDDSSDEEEDSDDDDGDGDGTHNKASSHKSRRKQAQRRRAEQEISRRETALADGTADENPETAADFERMLASRPNSSETWIRYMAFHLSLADVAAARRVAERALERIEFRQEGEKLNVWCALLTLELKYGMGSADGGGGDDDSNKSFQETLDRACQQNNPKQVYLRVCEMMAREAQAAAAAGGAGGPEAKYSRRADEYYAKMCRKFKDKKKTWLAHAEYLLKDGRNDEAHALVKRALLSLPNRKHVQTMSKFAQLVFEYDSTERARTLFDGLLSRYPKKLDLFFVYADKEVKHGDLDAARSLFQRACRGNNALEEEGTTFRMKLSSKQMKSLFKKWYAFEEKHGTPETREQVKEAARAYVDQAM